MAHPSGLLPDQQLRRARRRLFVQILLDSMTTAWVAALAICAMWLLLQPLVLPAAPVGLHAAVLGGTIGLATLAALALAVYRRPSRVETALAIDKRFGLKERLTTALTLTAEQAASPAGVALLADLQARMGPLQVGERFPVYLRRRMVWVPVLALLLVLVGVYYDPRGRGGSIAGAQDLPIALEQKADLERKLKQLEKKAQPKRPGERPLSKEQQRLEGELDKLARKPPQTREQAREMVKDLTEVEQRMRQRDKELAGRALAVKEQMRQLDRLTGKKPTDGPAQQLQKALDMAAFRKAKEEAEKLGRQLEADEQANRLRKKLKQPELTEEEKREAREQLKRLEGQELTGEQRQQLQRQMEEMAGKLEHLTRSEKARERLRQLERLGLLNKQQLQRELDQLDLNDAQLDPRTRELLQQLQQKLNEALKAMREGKDALAAQKLREAADLLRQLEGDGEGERTALGQQLRDLEALRQALCQALDTPGGPGGPASGRRPESKDGKTGAREEWAHSDLDKGQLQVIDHVPGEGFKGPRQPAEMAEDIRRAAQEAPEAIDRQRLPKSASDMARGYFEKIRGSK